ncbi:MAG TPA: class I SAM-dependent methyltransferase [Caulobacteraceae bacterium]|nr:class I SAM-dependent methyltransferase [Caulobacteraceae bacterium]
MSTNTALASEPRLAAPPADAAALVDWMLDRISSELEDTRLSEGARGLLRAYYYEAGLLDPAKRPFFDRHFREAMRFGLTEVMANGPRRVLDLGSGLGTQSFIFALLGADVVALDLDRAALDALEERKALLEADTGRSLSIQVVCADAFDWLEAPGETFDAAYSLFAFNMMLPTSRLVKALAGRTAAGGVVVIQDGNNRNLFKRVLEPRPDTLSKAELAACFGANGFAHAFSKPAVAVPPPLWRILPGGLVRALDGATRPLPMLALSYVHGFRRP